ncbi:hypothetical protein GCM10011403_24040 [Pseudohongiella nitratireducens]|jgi:hypothetical protein|uniref:Uncharacterized protein n=1 Tax=Pseudohongiella nitratireducens TaxID=1768907 RepID=A0A916VK43_9GAMM|nr:hypothetical protein [Pseudohongiella nitratireducens]MDF1623939.1 hypothetical protein [Pseudohongiella nitratireducens]GFZ80096.1 hypothetical protein GCM10011403_24040 [Pseudohongiella nitratireducens]|tara:strand:+ start:172 stop:342 length:171 start_codon:yes stop_codon:yes gene_type:complete
MTDKRAFVPMSVASGVGRRYDIGKMEAVLKAVASSFLAERRMILRTEVMPKQHLLA